MIQFEWESDAGGKCNYDGSVLTVDSRYWPAGYSKDGRPSAKSSLLILNEDGCYATLTSKEFSGETEAAVKADVERWVHEQVVSLREAMASVAFATYGVDLRSKKA